MRYLTKPLFQKLVQGFHAQVLYVLFFLGAMPTGLLFGQDSTREAAGSPSIESVRELTAKRIRLLGSDQYAERKLAQEQLAEHLPLIVDLLQKETQNPDPEIAARIKLLLAQVPQPNLFLVDAAGDPVPFAQVSLDGIGIDQPSFPFAAKRVKPELKEVRISQSTYSDARGGIALKEFGRGQVECIVGHPDFGRARIVIHFPLRHRKLDLPLVAVDSPAFKRAVSGIVQDSSGKRVVGASIKCSTVRTPGDGLIQSSGSIAEALTDEKGEFRYYLPNQPAPDRGEWIPLNSHYQLQISMPGDSKNIPVAGRFNNLERAKIVFFLADRVHRFTFESFDAKQATAEELVKTCFVSYFGPDGRQAPARLDTAKALKGLKLKTGIYRAQRQYGSQFIEMQPIEVTPSSREELRFRLPPTVEYRGRVIHGVTRRPLANAIVFSYSATKQGSLASLTEQDWKSLVDVPKEKLRAGPGFKRVNQIFVVQQIARTDESGEFSLVQPPDLPSYGLIALGKNYLPYGMSNYQLLPKRDPAVPLALLKSRIKEFPLFPAAKVKVKPVVIEADLLDNAEFGKRRISILPVWQIPAANQDPMIKLFRKAQQYHNGKFQYDSWLTHNQSQSIFVPAGLNLTLQLNTPYNEFVSPTNIQTSINLKQGEVKDLGEVRFRPALKVKVQVIDEHGAGVEGLPVRRRYKATNSWSLVHNTDAAGEVTFGMNRNSVGTFRVGESVGDSTTFQPVLASFKVGESASDVPIQIKVTTKQVAEMRRNQRSNR